MERLELAIRLSDDSDERAQFLYRLLEGRAHGASELESLSRLAEARHRWAEPTVRGQWESVAAQGRLNVLDDSPGTNYDNNANVVATSPSIATSGGRQATLEFDARHQLESRYDFLRVEVQGEDGE